MYLCLCVICIINCSKLLKLFFNIVIYLNIFYHFSEYNYINDVVYRILAVICIAEVMIIYCKYITGYNSHSHNKLLLNYSL